MFFWICLCLLVLVLAGCVAAARRDAGPGVLRVATFNTSLYDNADGGVIARLRRGDEKARKIAAVIQQVRPDLLLLNEFDYDQAGEAASIFERDYLGKGQYGRAAIDYPHRYFAPVNTGVPSGLDIDRDGRTDGPSDAWGFGFHPGQYGMLVLSRHPILADEVRSFRLFPWHEMPDARAPMDPKTGKAYYDEATWKQLRLSSKSHWDVPVATPLGTLHFLVSHPTPPVFDGPEDRNGARNHDEIRLWADYIDPARAAYLRDDAGGRGGLDADASFVIAGDLNSDPMDGAGLPGAIAQLLDHPRVLASSPASEGALEATRKGGGPQKRGAPQLDTAAFGPQSGNLRADYVLPSRNFKIVDSGVFWPRAGDPDAQLLDATDHHLVWLDLALVR